MQIRYVILIFRLGNLYFQIQHTQINLKSLFTSFYPKMPLAKYRSIVWKNGSSLFGHRAWNDSIIQLSCMIPGAVMRRKIRYLSILLNVFFKIGTRLNGLHIGFRGWWPAINYWKSRRITMFRLLSAGPFTKVKASKAGTGKSPITGNSPNLGGSRWGPIFFKICLWIISSIHQLIV